MMPSNKRMQETTWKDRCEAALLTIATLTVQWSGAKAERKRLTHTMFKARQKLEELHALLQAMPEGKLRVDTLWCLQSALEMTYLNTPAIGKKAAKKEGLALP